MSDSPITPEERAEWRRLHEAATPGPWWQKCYDRPTADGVEISNLLCYFDDESGPRFWKWHTDGEFVAASREAVPRLLDALESVERERDEAKAIVAIQVRALASRQKDNADWEMLVDKLAAAEARIRELEGK